jgi:hypothetical protein
MRQGVIATNTSGAVKTGAEDERTAMAREYSLAAPGWGTPAGVSEGCQYNGAGQFLTGTVCFCAVSAGAIRYVAVNTAASR